MNTQNASTDRRSFLNTLAIGGLGMGIAATSRFAHAAPSSAEVLHVGGPECAFHTVQAALAAIVDATPDKPYLVLVEPGVYDIADGGGPIVLKPYVSIAGMDRRTTVFRSSDAYYFGYTSASSISNLTILHTSTQTTSAAIRTQAAGATADFLLDSANITVRGPGAGFRATGYLSPGELRDCTFVTEGTGISIEAGGHVFVHDCQVHLISGSVSCSHLGIVGNYYCRIFVFGGKIGTGYGYDDIVDPTGSVVGCLARPQATGRIHLFGVWSICRNISDDPRIAVNCVRNESAALRIRVFNCYLQSEASSLEATQTLARTSTGKIEVFGTRYAEIGESSLFSTNQIGLQHYDTSANGTVIGGNTTPTNGGLILVDASKGPFSLTLPNPANSVPTEEFIFKKTDSTSNPVTINGGRSLIDGSGTYRLTSPYQRVQLRFADSRYYVVG